MRVDVYVIESSAPEARFQVAARLLEKASGQGLRTWVTCSNADDANAFDQWLWTYKATSFLPHSLANSTPDALDPPIQISPNNQAPKQATFDLLLNLGDDIPLDYTTFKRTLDLVPHHAKEAGRTRYRAYREQNAELHQHTV